MKKVLLSLVVLGSLALPFAPAFADATSTPPIPGGHAQLVAGFVDSVNNKGAWIFNFPAIGQISYTADHPELQTQWTQLMDSFYHISL